MAYEKARIKTIRAYHNNAFKEGYNGKEKI
ncbi:hypothetical protein SAMN05421797_10522 [Maribacter ulvicola]|uniref:Uncharacterized protein n=1 Tax=Maribacter ulvicola TaxID=228959 RepID=A0A1N6X7X9_9FLAO|nr:hypothetical protein SAMN05421797_10522 [Maribacter ulvicola]